MQWWLLYIKPGKQIHNFKNKVSVLKGFSPHKPVAYISKCVRCGWWVQSLHSRDYILMSWAGFSIMYLKVLPGLTQGHLDCTSIRIDKLLLDNWGLCLIGFCLNSALPLFHYVMFHKYFSNLNFVLLKVNDSLSFMMSTWQNSTQCMLNA